MGSGVIFTKDRAVSGLPARRAAAAASQTCPSKRLTPAASRRSRTASHSSNAMSRLRTIPWSCGSIRVGSSRASSGARAEWTRSRVRWSSRWRRSSARVTPAMSDESRRRSSSLAMQQRLYFLPLPQGQGSLRPTRSTARRRVVEGASSSSSRPSRRGARAISRNGSVHLPAAGRSLPAGRRATRPLSSSSPSRSDVAARKASTSRPRATRASMRARRTTSSRWRSSPRSRLQWAARKRATASLSQDRRPSATAPTSAPTTSPATCAESLAMKPGSGRSRAPSTR